MDVTPVQFVRWASKAYADTFQEISAAWTMGRQGFNYTNWVTPAGMENQGGLGDDTSGPSWQQLSPDAAGFINDLAQNILQLQRQRDLDNINAQRAAQGLPPLGPDWQTTRPPAGAAGSAGSSTMLLLAAVGAVVYFGAGKGRGRKLTRWTESGTGE